MTEGWICPQCKRGVAPGEKYCDHGETDFDYVSPPPRRTFTVPVRISDCGCPPGSVCGSSACPRNPIGPASCGSNFACDRNEYGYTLTHPQ